MRNLAKGGRKERYVGRGMDQFSAHSHRLRRTLHMGKWCYDAFFYNHFLYNLQFSRQGYFIQACEREQLHVCIKCICTNSSSPSPLRYVINSRRTSKYSLINDIHIHNMNSNYHYSAQAPDANDTKYTKQQCNSVQTHQPHESTHLLNHPSPHSCSPPSLSPTPHSTASPYHTQAPSQSPTPSSYPP